MVRYANSTIEWSESVGWYSINLGCFYSLAYSHLYSTLSSTSTGSYGPSIGNCCYYTKAISTTNYSSST